MNVNYLLMIAHKSAKTMKVHSPATVTQDTRSMLLTKNLAMVNLFYIQNVSREIWFNVVKFFLPLSIMQISTNVRPKTTVHKIVQTQWALSLASVIRDSLLTKSVVMVCAYSYE